MVRDLVHHVSSPLVGEQSSAGGFFLAPPPGLEPALPTELRLILTNLFFFGLSKLSYN